MTRYRILGANGAVLAEGSFATYDEAKSWAAVEEPADSYTLYYRESSGRWTALRHFPGTRAAGQQVSTNRP